VFRDHKPDAHVKAPYKMSCHHHHHHHDYLTRIPVHFDDRM